MPKRVILCLLAFCLLLILSSCSAGAKDTTPTVSAKTQAPVDTAAQTDTAVSGYEEDTLDVLYSVSKAFLNVHYNATVSETKEYEQLQTEISNAFSSMSPPPSSGLYNSGLYSLEDINPDLAERYEALFKQKYQTQSLTDKGFDTIVKTSMPIHLWKIVLKADSDIEVSSVKTLIKNVDTDDKRNDINYTINLLINKASYEVTGVLTLMLVDNKWMVDNIHEIGWTPKPSY